MLLIRSEDLTVRPTPAFEQGDARGFYLGEGGFTGWDDGVTMRSETAPRPQAHGDFDSRGWLAGRMVNLSGWCIGESPYDLLKFRDQLMGHGAWGDTFRVDVTRDGKTLFGTARLAAATAPTFVDVGNGLRASWSVSWWFPDPRKYGEEFTGGPGSSVTVVHRGNFRAEAKIRVTGNAPGGYTITGPAGRDVVITRALAPGDEHLFDMASMSLYVNGIRVLGGVGRAERWAMPTGASTITVTGGLSMTVTARHTYI